MTHVLVVDDDDSVRETLRAALEDDGYDVTTAPDGHAALAHLRMADTPLVVLIDERMPGLSGTEVVETYLAGAPTSRREFILLTGSLDTVPVALNGRVPVLAKPFNLDALLDAVATASGKLRC